MRKEIFIDLVQSMSVSQLEDYVKKVEEQLIELKQFHQQLKAIQARKQKEINKKLRDSGPRGAT